MIKLKTALLIAALMNSYMFLHAQKNSVHLKNGSIVFGKITEIIPDSIIKIKDECGNIWALKYSDVKTFDQNGNKDNSFIESSLRFQFGFELGFAGFGGYSDPGLSFLLSGKYNFNERISGGIITGAEYFEIPLLPVAGEISFDIFKRRATPYLYIRGGYGFKLINNEENNDYTAKYKGGPMFGGGIGIKKRFNPEFALTFSIGYRHQQTYEERDYLYYDWWYTDYSRQYFMNRAAFKIGFIF